MGADHIAMVSGVDNNSVVQCANSLEPIKQFTDAVIHEVDASIVSFYSTGALFFSDLAITAPLERCASIWFQVSSGFLGCGGTGTRLRYLRMYRAGAV